VEGNGSVPFFYFQKRMITMTTSTELEKIEEFVKSLIEKPGNLFLVEIKSAPGNKITVLLDGDQGITIDDCTRVSKALYKFIEETGLLGDKFSLEVSSPGVDKPLKLLRQYNKNIGRKVEVVLQDGTRQEGILAGVTETEITLEEKTGKGSKTIIKTITILFNQIKHTKVLITF
jgi:ribosome maturation factor RimP